jgi:hypothetical protein
MIPSQYFAHQSLCQRFFCPRPKVSTVEEEEDIDPTVAEMNRRNAQRTQQQTEKEGKSAISLLKDYKKFLANLYFCL